MEHTCECGERMGARKVKRRTAVVRGLTCSSASWYIQYFLTLERDYMCKYSKPVMLFVKITNHCYYTVIKPLRELPCAGSAFTKTQLPNGILMLAVDK